MVSGKLTFEHEGLVQTRSYKIYSPNEQYIEVYIFNDSIKIINHVMSIIPICDVYVRYNSRKKMIEIGDRVKFNFTRYRCE